LNTDAKKEAYAKGEGFKSWYDLEYNVSNNRTKVLKEAFLEGNQIVFVYKIKNLSNQQNPSVAPAPVIQTTSNVFERTDKIILRSELKANPATLYLFGDNDIREGLGGQAKEMRGEPNAVGISTKKLPAKTEEAYKSDVDLEKNKKIITEDINKAIAEWNKGKYNKLIIPQIGVGLAELPTRAPETYKFLQQELKRLENYVSKQSSISEPKGEKVKDGIYVNQEGLTKEEQLELFEYLKPILEKQAIRSNTGANAPKMAGLELNWDYIRNRPNQKRVDVKGSLRPNDTYGWFEESANGLPLEKMTPRFKELMSKAVGIDVSNYDGAIINIYNDNSFISNHPDIDESKTAEKYPVVVANIGGTGNIVLGTNKANDSRSLKAGAGYLFGFQGKNRMIPHSTYASSTQGFLPAITTEIDGETYPTGSYRISITMRRVMPLELGMPTSPKLLTTQPSSIKENVEVYQGYNTLENREFNYYTLNEEEAKNYGKNVRKVNLNTKDFLKYTDPAYNTLLSEFNKSGKTFDILDNSKEGLSVQESFFRFLKSKGYKGLSLLGRIDNNYVITFSEPSVNEFDLADKLTPIEQKFKDDDGGRQMQDKFKGKSTMDLIISGDRTRTTRANTDIQRMAKDYSLSKISDLAGKVIRMTDKTGRQVYTRITKVAKFTQEYQDATWQKEGWIKSVTDKHVGDYPYAIEFEVINKPTQQPTSSKPATTAPVVSDKKADIERRRQEEYAKIDASYAKYIEEGEKRKKENIEKTGLAGDTRSLNAMKEMVYNYKQRVDKLLNKELDELDTIEDKKEDIKNALTYILTGKYSGKTDRKRQSVEIGEKIAEKIAIDLNNKGLIKQNGKFFSNLDGESLGVAWSVGKYFAKEFKERFDAELAALEIPVSNTEAKKAEADKLTPTQQPTNVNPLVAAEYTNHSGGAEGSDSEWDKIDKEFGMVNNKHYYTGEKGPKNAPLGNVDISNQPIAIEGATKVAEAAKEMWGYKYNTMKDPKLIRNWAQVYNSDAVFAIGTLGKIGDVWKHDEKAKEPRRLLKYAVQGGTGYAVEMAIQSGKPVYLFDQVRNQWYKNINNTWSKSEIPVLTKNFAGVGTREINEMGIKAIRDVYKNTFKNATSKPIINNENITDLSKEVINKFRNSVPWNYTSTDEELLDMYDKQKLSGQTLEEFLQAMSCLGKIK